MKILFVAMTNSIHTARWIEQLRGTSLCVHVFPSINTDRIHPLLKRKNVIFHIPWQIKYRKNNLFRKLFLRIYYHFYGKTNRFYVEDQLRKVILKIKPDIIHSLETQHSGYLVNAVKSNWYGHFRFPKWIHTNWGSDIYLFGRLTDHVQSIRHVLANCDYYSSESYRDNTLARQYGFSGHVFAPFPNTGGFHLYNLLECRSRVKTSERKEIMVKGYQGWAGRALFALAALKMISEHLSGYTINIFSNPDGYDIKIAAELFEHDTGIKVNVLPYINNYNEMLSLYSRARIYIGLSISDAISTSLLESMVMGTFPIQSDTSTANEWINNGVTGFIVPPEDLIKISNKVRVAIFNDSLVDNAAEKNLVIAKNRLNYDLVRRKTLGIYDKIKADIGKESYDV
ncbi:hypothetical protein B4O97_11870 [Marispirochaeta aestuarii]|uniref:Glycosyl transferase family 1 domain-containing protein n=1 Tax=Marispirochaeta aestuarii TaxID=1963862 RepID=A0A1Y1RWU3_9SPIO|nr:glycosyltransferase [Marispirochaeta aestuarii]ORC34638.1 hypothetical protein B4O97_11870 [Marispirochaeta aestuarii]